MRTRADFVKARDGKRHHSKSVVLQARDRQDGNDIVRFGYTVTKKVGNAVERNRIRRRLRECQRQLRVGNELPRALVGHDVVVIARRVAINVPFADLVAELKTALERLVANSGSKGQKRAKSQPDAAQKLRKSGKDHKST